MIFSVISNLILFFLGLLGLGSVIAFLTPKNKARYTDAMLFGLLLMNLLWFFLLDVTTVFRIVQFSIVFLFLIERSLAKSFAFFLILLVLCLGFVASPIAGWDQRSIWFFHAKILFFTSGDAVFQTLGDPSIRFSHPEYPKLLAVTSALVNVPQAWGEYLPKMGMALLTLPVVAYSLIEKVSLMNRMILLAVVFFVAGGFFSCTIDLTLASYAGLAVYGLFFSQNPLTGILFLSLMPHLKIEGGVLAVLIFVAYLFKERKLALPSMPLLVPVSLSFILFVAYQIKCAQYDVKSYFTQADVPVLTRFLGRLMDPHQIWIVIRSFLQANRAVLILFCVGFFYRKRFKLPVAMVPWVYLFFLMFVYLSTPLDLVFHLRTSIERVVIPLFAVMVVSAWCEKEPA